jgi:hypothetical protein
MSPRHIRSLSLVPGNKTAGNWFADGIAGCAPAALLNRYARLSGKQRQSIGAASFVNTHCPSPPPPVCRPAPPHCRQGRAVHLLYQALGLPTGAILLLHCGESRSVVSAIQTPLSAYIFYYKQQQQVVFRGSDRRARRKSAADQAPLNRAVGTAASRRRERSRVWQTRGRDRAIVRRPRRRCTAPPTGSTCAPVRSSNGCLELSMTERLLRVRLDLLC